MQAINNINIKHVEWNHHNVGVNKTLPDKMSEENNLYMA